jgi:broad specificity phosphatase PhoE
MPARLLAAPQVRSLDTIRPLGADLGLPVEAEPALAEETYAARPHDGLARMKDLASAGPMTAVCASGAVIRHLIAALAADGGLWLEEVRAKKGSVWALFFSSCRLAAADYYPAMTSASG